MKVEIIRTHWLAVLSTREGTELKGKPLDGEKRGHRVGVTLPSGYIAWLLAEDIKEISP